MFDSILIPYDGSQSSEQALSAGIGIAGRTGATIRVVYVVDLGGIPGNVDELLSDPENDLTVEETGREILDEAAERVEAAGVPVEREVLRGKAAPTLLEHVGDHAVDLLVLGHHDRGRLRRFLRQSVAEQVVQASTVPVLAVPEAYEGDATTLETILLATDGRSGTRRATDLAFGLASAYEAHLLGLYVLDSRFTGSSALQSVLEREGKQTLRDLETRSARSGVAFSGERREGEPAKEILAAATDADADLIVLGTRGGTNIDRLVMGSVAGRVLRNASVPVLTARTIEDAD